MNISKAIYVMYFWQYATAEQIEDMSVLSIDMIVEYILEIGKEYYLQYGIAKDNKKTIIELVNLIENKQKFAI
jgi:hypothetical protein